jgi:chromosome segregation ATPase
LRLKRGEYVQSEAWKAKIQSVKEDVHRKDVEAERLKSQVNIAIEERESNAESLKHYQKNLENLEKELESKNQQVRASP